MGDCPRFALVVAGLRLGAFFREIARTVELRRSMVDKPLSGHGRWEE